MKKPTLDLGPKLNRAIMQPQTMITSGVRQVVAEANGRSSPSVAAMQIPRWLGRIIKDFDERVRCESRQHIDARRN
jgi:hypothetical protein